MAMLASACPLLAGHEAAAQSAPVDTLRLQRQVGGEAVRISYITSLVVTPRQLIAGDIGYSPHLVVFDRSTGRLSARFGADGAGFGHLQKPSCMTPVVGEASRLWVFDRSREVLAQVRLDRRADEAFVREIPLHDLPSVALCAAWMPGGVVVHSYTPDYLRVADSSGRTTRTLDITPPFQEHADLNPTSFAISPSGRRMALAYEYANRVDLIDHTGRHYATIRGPRPTNELKYGIVGQPGDAYYHALVSATSEKAYLALAASDSFLYALFSGCAGECRYTGTQVHVFRWDGVFVREFALDQRVLKIAVSPDDAVLYGAYAQGAVGYEQRLGEWILPSAPSRRPAAGSRVRSERK